MDGILIALAGSEPGASLSLRHNGARSVVLADGARRALLAYEWTECVIKSTRGSGADKSVRVFVLEPSEAPVSHEVRVTDRLRVFGFFNVARRVNNPRQALEVWRDYAHLGIS